MPIIDERAELLKLLEILEARRRYHHASLWEEEKHFTWWISIVLPVTVYIHVHPGLTPLGRWTLMTLASLLGIGISAIALRVVRREGQSFTETLQGINRLTSALQLDQSLTYTCVPEDRRLPITPGYPITHDFAAAQAAANKPLPLLICSAARHLAASFRVGAWRPIQPPRVEESLGVRDCFQLIFMSAMGVFILFFLWAARTHLLGTRWPLG